MSHFLTHLTDLFVREGDAAAGGPMSGMTNNLTNLLPFALMFVVIYVMLVRPASKQRKEHQELLNQLKKDDEVVTSSGMYGRIAQIDERVATLEISDKVKIRLLRDRIAGRWNPGNANTPVQSASAPK